MHEFTGSSGSRTTASTGSQLDTNQPAETGGSNSAGGNGSGGSESSSGGGLSAASIGIICSVVGVVIAAIGLGVKIAYARRGARADREASFGKADSQTSMPGSSNNNGGWYRERIEREGYGASRH